MEEKAMPVDSGTSRDRMFIIGPSKRMTKGTKKKPAKKVGAMGTPKRKAVKRKAAKKTRK
jgi:hypothetical protein